MRSASTPQPVVQVRRAWSFVQGKAQHDWGVLLRGHDGQPVLVTAATPEEVGAAVTAHLRALAGDVVEVAA
jgi:hypothetical protein